ncbi:hypothetical protein RCH12_001364 [Cryobacterium sp. MP_3.1]|uniref:hypothetical protein n=1 Tax=Cryobacterium sp. MP_3.1 TaxID=3071711 RepID=UPI002E0B99CB|nr:hypothetical protein [Cryobacterium sp. MP_3.1]
MTREAGAYGLLGVRNTPVLGKPDVKFHAPSVVARIPQLAQNLLAWTQLAQNRPCAHVTMSPHPEIRTK